MEIRYSEHLLLRLRMRGIPHGLPRIAYEHAHRRFYDHASRLNIAVFRMDYSGKRRDVALSYRTDANNVLLITIHPLKANQLENRVKSGRWTEI